MAQPVIKIGNRIMDMPTFVFVAAIFFLMVWLVRTLTSRHSRQKSHFAEGAAKRSYVPLASGQSKLYPNADEHRFEEQKYWSWQRALEERRDKISFATLVLTLIAVVAAGSSFLQTWRQANIAQITLNEIRKTSAQQLRAYIGVGGVTTARPTPTWPDIQLILTLKNFGQTLARSSIIRKTMDFRSSVANGDYDVDTQSTVPYQTNIAIAPGQNFEYPFDQTLTLKEQADFASRRSVFVVYGSISYLDISSTLQSTEFCYEFKFADIQGRPCRNHNVTNQSYLGN